MILKILLFLQVTCVLLISAADKSWDYMKFAQEWAPSVCVDGDMKNHLYGYRHDCSIGKNVTTWTIHGLWPTKNHTLGPNNCDTSDPFDPNAVQSLIPQLNKYWPNLFADTKKNDFWKHEWEKHGTCAMSLPALNSEFNYFSMVLKLNQHYNLLNAFELAGITPSKTVGYKFSQIQDALKQFKNPPVSCVKDAQKQYVGQISLCLDKSFDTIDCRYSRYTQHSLFNEPESCNSTEPVYFPPFVKQ